MTLFLITLAVFGLVLLGMSVGVIFGNRPIRGTCGGLSHAEGTPAQMTCDACCLQGQHCTPDGNKQVPTQPRARKVDA